MYRPGALWICLLIILAVVSVNAAGKEKRKKDRRIVGGRPINITEAPYTVQLRTKSGFTFCGGSLLSTRYVISAAHCLKYNKPSNIVIVAGATYNNETGVQSTIAETILPQGYNYINTASVHDVVIFKLSSSMPINGFIQSIDLCDEPLTPGTSGQVSGWGATYNRGLPSYQLNAVRVPIVDRDECARMYTNLTLIHGTMFCAANLGYDQDSCSGDSGGPFVIKGKLCGAVSWGTICAHRDYPGIYTSIDAMRDFIQQALRG